MSGLFNIIYVLPIYVRILQFQICIKKISKEEYETKPYGFRLHQTVWLHFRYCLFLPITQWAEIDLNNKSNPSTTNNRYPSTKAHAIWARNVYIL